MEDIRRTEQQRWDDHIRMEQMFYDPVAQRGGGENKEPSHRSVRKSLNYRKRAPRCENCVRFEWLSNGGGPNCTLGRFRASPLGICDQWSAAKGNNQRTDDAVVAHLNSAPPSPKETGNE